MKILIFLNPNGIVWIRDDRNGFCQPRYYRNVTPSSIVRIRRMAQNWPYNDGATLANY